MNNQFAKNIFIVIILLLTSGGRLVFAGKKG